MQDFTTRINNESHVASPFFVFFCFFNFIKSISTDERIFTDRIHHTKYTYDRATLCKRLKMSTNLTKKNDITRVAIIQTLLTMKILNFKIYKKKSIHSS